MQEAWGTRPLLKSQLVYSCGEVSMVPNREQLTSTLMMMFDDMAEAITTLTDDFLTPVMTATSPHASPTLTHDGWKDDRRFQIARC